MSLLSSCRDDLPEPDDAGLLAARSRLEARMRTATPARVRRSAPVRRRALLGAVASAVAVAAVVAATAGPAPQASAEASRLLEGAAATVPPGSGPRSLLIRSEGLSERLGDDGSVVAAYSAVSVAALRIPAGAGEWVRRTWSLPATAFYGGQAAQDLAQQEGALGTPSRTERSPLVERSPDGDFTNGELGGGRVFGDDPAALAALPTDPERLLQALRVAHLGAGATRGQAEQVLEAASAVLSTGAADPDLQAALFRALRLQPGLTVTDRAVDLLGRQGVAVGAARPSWPYEARQLILEAGTGRYLGDRDVALRAQGVIPAGAVLSATAVTER